MSDDLAVEEEPAEDLASVARASSARAAAMLANAPKRTTVYVADSPQGRVTGWAVVCPDHGAMDVLAPGRDAAVAAAARHLEEGHKGRGDVKVIRPKRGKARGRRRG